MRNWNGAAIRLTDREWTIGIIDGPNMSQLGKRSAEQTKALGFVAQVCHERNCPGKLCQARGLLLVLMEAKGHTPAIQRERAHQTFTDSACAACNQCRFHQTHRLCHCRYSIEHSQTLFNLTGTPAGVYDVIYEEGAWTNKNCEPIWEQWTLP